MIDNKNGLRGPAIIARQLQGWAPSDSPDLIYATMQYVAEEWLHRRKASPTAVYAVYAMARDSGARGDVEAAVIACALERLLEQHGCLELSFTTVPDRAQKRSRIPARSRH